MTVRAKLPAPPIADNDMSGAIRVAFASMPPKGPGCLTDDATTQGGATPVVGAAGSGRDGCNPR
jgi:hypothetical protein